MRFNNIIVLGASALILGILFLLKFFQVISSPYTLLASYIFIFYGFTAAYFSFGTGYRGNLFFASIIFLSGIMMYVINNFEILQPSSAVFSSILFISGASFIVLYIDNIKERIFLYSGLLLMLISYFSITFFKNSDIVDTANRLSNLVIDYWPVFLLLFGINILLMRKR